MKAFFATRTRREQALLLLFLAVALLGWGSAVLGRLRLAIAEGRAVLTERATQDVWLSHRTEIAGQAERAAQQLDPAHTLDAAQLLTELNQFATGLSIEIGAQRTERTPSFAVHSMQVNLRRVDLPGLLRFYGQITARAPYIGIEQCTLTNDRANPGLLNISLRISAVQAVPP